MRPTIFWSSDPVLPGETVLVTGCGFGTHPVAELQRLEDQCAAKQDGAPDAAWQKVKPLQSSEDCVKFVLPDDCAMGQFAVRVNNGRDSSDPVIVNSPDIWWMQADTGETATPGGWIRIFGKCLNLRAYAGGARGAPASEVRLKAADGKTMFLQVQHADCYGLTAAVSAETLSGQYAVQIHNGYAGEDGWRDAGMLVVALPPAWPAEVFNVMDFYGERALEESKRSWEFNDWATDVEGCTREDKFGIDRTEAIQAALRKAEKNGGGIIFFPRGRYRFRGGTLKIPSRTTLKGEGMNSSWFYWDRNEAVPDPMVSGDDFMLQDMTFYFPMEFKMGIVVPAASRRFVMQRVRLRVFDQSNEWDKPITEDKSPSSKGTSLQLEGRNFQVTECDLHSTANAIMMNGANHGLIARNRFLHWWRLCNFESTHHIIMEDNNCLTLSILGFSNFTTYWTVATEQLYYARNRHIALYPDRSSNDWTLDFGTAAYLGKVKADGTSLTLAEDPKFGGFWGDNPPRDWGGAIVTILAGRGAGQYRRVVRNNGRSWQIDHPWQVLPDDTSTISITSFQGKLLFLNNEMEDAAWVAMAYSCSTDIVAAGNILRRCGSFHTYGRTAVEWGYPPCWFSQFLDNRIEDGNTRFKVYGLPTKELKQPFEESGVTRGHVFRRNTMMERNTGHMAVGESVADVIMENCVTREMQVDEHTSGILLRNNRWLNGAPDYTGDGLKNALVIPGPGPAK